MAKKLKSRPFDAAVYLTSNEAISAYLEDALSSDDPRVVAKAFGTVARAHGMSKVAKKAGLSRESLYKALSSDGNPEFATMVRVLGALGLKFSITAASAR